MASARDAQGERDAEIHSRRQDLFTDPRGRGPGARGFAIVAGLMISAAWMSAQSSSIVFRGLAHTAVGGAVLRLDQAREALTVATFDPSGEDGVAVALREANSWTARMEATGDDSLPLGLSWHAIADSHRISSASMRRVGKTFEISAVFTGAARPTYARVRLQQWTPGRFARRPSTHRSRRRSRRLLPGPGIRGRPQLPAGLEVPQPRMTRARGN